MNVSERHRAAYERRCGLQATLMSCICCWPNEIEPTSTGHADTCPAHAELERERSHRYEPGVGWVALDGSVEASANPHACCARDLNGYGNCDVHSAPGVLRKDRLR